MKILYFQVLYLKVSTLRQPGRLNNGKFHIHQAGDGSTRIFPVSFKILGDDYIQGFM